ncbi:MAG: hypothetical protein ABEI06_01680 [Halobacteriaceae archaeon]
MSNAVLFEPLLAINNMEIKGYRECRECGHQWSYYETGNVQCPECGSIKSTGLDERTLHTNNPVEIDITSIQSLVSNDEFRQAGQRAAKEARNYTIKRGFIHKGDLIRCDERIFSCHELRNLGNYINRTASITEETEYYFIETIQAVKNSGRPDQQAIPKNLRSIRGLAYARAAKDYLNDVTTWIEYADHELPSGGVLERTKENIKRVEALDGDISIGDSERIYEIVANLYSYCTTGEISTYEQIEEYLSNLEKFQDS